MSYEQSIRHACNHRKDRYYQQCSGYYGPGAANEAVNKSQDLSKETMRKILESNNQFPLYIKQVGNGYWYISDHDSMAASKIESYEELIHFAEMYE